MLHPIGPSFHQSHHPVLQVQHESNVESEEHQREGPHQALSKRGQRTRWTRWTRTRSHVHPFHSISFHFPSVWMFFLSILHCQRNVRQLPSISVSGSMISIDLMSKTSCQMDSDHVAICRYRIYRGYGFHTPFLIASTDPVISRNHCCHCSATPWRSWWILLPLNSRRHWPTSCTAVINMICDTEAQAPKKTTPCCFVLPWTELKGQLSSAFVVWAFKRVCLRHHNDSLRGHSCNEHAHAKPSAQNTCAGPTQGKRGLGT